MEPLSQVSGRACPVDLNDVDTDLIIPKQFLKSVTKTGFGPYAFKERRYLEDGSPDPDFPLNKSEHAGAPILVTGRNFGCGSSREHAPWALQDAGFDVIIAPSFADIFRTNCAKIGVLCVQLDESVVRRLFDLVAADPGVEVRVDLETQTVAAPAAGEHDGIEVRFEVDQHTKHCLLHGLDSIDLTLEDADAIDAYEADRPTWRPRIPATV